MQRLAAGRVFGLFKRSRVARIAALVLGICILAPVALISRHWMQGSETIRVGFSQFSPYVEVNEAGEPDGLAVEMVKRAARLSGVPIRWVLVKGDAEEALEHGQIDVYPLLTLTEARRRRFYVSQPWWENEIALISLETRPLRVSADTSGKRLAIRGLPVVKALAEKLFPAAHFVIVPRMEDLVKVLCAGKVDGFFLDLRLLQSQLLQGTSQCPGHGLHVASVPNGSLSLSTFARFSESRAADRLFEAIAQFSADGTLSDIASHWSLFNPYEGRHVKDVLEAQHRASMMHYGLAGLIISLILISFQAQRLRRSRAQANRARLLAEESQQRFDAFMRYMPALAFIKSADGRVEFVNDAYCRLFGLQRENAVGKLDLELWPAAIAERFRENDLRVLSSNTPEEVVEVAPDESGRSLSFLVYKFPFANASGDSLLGGVAIDITDRLEAENALKLSQFSIDCAQDTMLWIDNAGLICNANGAACRNLGFLREELVGMHVSSIDPMVDREGFAHSRAQLKAAGSMTVESLHRGKNGVIHPVEISQNFLAFQGQEYSCCISRDITDRKQAEAELSRQALHDTLTGLPNRRYLESRLADIIEQARARKTNAGVIYLDLDGFKLVNDSLGHPIGDQLLRQVATRLKESLRACDMLFRMGGDEFSLVLNNVADDAEIALISHKLLANLHEGFSVEGHELSITASVGVSMFPRDGSDGNQLLRSADAAMYESKRQGKNRVQFFTPEMGEQTRERLDLENQLRLALARNELSLHFQPQFCLPSGKIVRHEALLRWNHPVLGNIPPSKFIPIAEDTSLILPIGAWVLEEACRHAAAWQDEAAGVGVGVNVSLLQFNRADFVDTVTEVLRSTGLPAHLLELELTESVMMHYVDDSAVKIARLRSLGLSVTIDDFGTGYSSLSYLRKLPINSLKIDRSFVRDIEHNANAVSLTAALISMAHSLGMRVVVEGIETSEQLERVQQLGCDIGQGYFLGRPSPAPLMLVDSVAA